jgi:hypothetical protein
MVGSMTDVRRIAFAFADSQKHPHHINHNARHFDNSLAAIAERQRHAGTFDNTQYFEHDSNKIPFGTLEWWDQRRARVADWVGL